MRKKFEQISIKKSTEKKERILSNDDLFYKYIAKKADEAEEKMMEERKSAERHTGYMFFTPEWYTEKKFITREMILKLRSGGNMLSVGSGAAFLERFISKTFKIPEKQMDLADITIHPELKGEFNTIQFDLTQEWPKDLQKYDYILFPESFGVAFMDFRKSGWTFRFSDVTEKVIPRILEGHTETVDASDLELFLSVVETDVPYVKMKLKTLEQAMEHLNPGGEIRISYSGMSDQEMAYVIAKLKKSHPSAKCEGRARGDFFIVSQGKSQQLPLNPAK